MEIISGILLNEEGRLTNTIMVQNCARIQVPVNHKVFISQREESEMV